jgi:hypothetical protein
MVLLIICHLQFSPETGTIATLAAQNYILRLQLRERHARFLKSGGTICVGACGNDNPMLARALSARASWER